VAEAQHALGRAYLSGLFGETSLEEGLTLIRRSADAGYSAALNSLGAIYESGRHGEHKNEKQAHEYYLAAAAAGDTVAMLNLAHLYRRGVPGVPQDLPRAKTWAQRAVDNGNWGAQSTLKALQREEEERQQQGRFSKELLDEVADPHARQCTTTSFIPPQSLPTPCKVCLTYANVAWQHSSGCWQT
jgi:TPR repeat protein